MAELAIPASGSIMSEAKPTPTSAPAGGSGDSAAVSTSREKESGRVTFDSRGDPIWEWRTGEETFQRDASTSLVKKLEAPYLTLESTTIVRKQHGAPEKAAAPSCGGFDPYDNGSAPGGGARVPSRQAPARPQIRPATTVRPRDAGLLQKLQSWMGGRGPSRSR